MQANDAIHLGCEPLVMGGDQRRASFATYEIEEFGEDLVGRGLVEISGRLVGEDHGGLLASARATATRCCSPPESFDGRWSRRAPRPSLDSRSRARSRADLASAPAMICGMTTFSSASKSGNRWWNW